MSDISPEYDECPTICFREQSERTTFCDSCEIKVAKDIFKEETINILDDRFKDKWKIYSFDNILKTIIGIIDSEDDDRSTWPISTEILFDVYSSQKTRLKRVDDWNYKQKLKSNKDGD